MRSNHAVLFVAAILSSLLWASPARAQPNFSRLKVKLGDLVYVTDPSGVEVGGPLRSLSPSALTIDGQEFKPAPGLKIERSGDSLRNGTLIGTAIGTAVGVTAFGGCVSRQGCPAAAATFLAWTAYFGAVGAFIDWRIKGRTTIYDTRVVGKPSVRIAPEVTPSRRAFRVTVSF